MKKAEVTRGPFDPGGQPETRTGHGMELGFFAWNIKGGMTASKAVLTNPERYQDFWHWPNAMRMVRLAEQIGYDYQVPFARWIGQGGESNYNDSNLDFLSSAAALSPVTSRLGLFSTAHVTYKFHPLHFAKFGATIDHICNGRWGLNIVSGAGKWREMAAFGMKDPIPHDVGYDMADEFTTLLKYLWSEDGPIEFEGEYYQSYGGVVSPKPVRSPRPVLMNAGNSEKGLDFACRQVDWVFLTAPSLEGYRERVETVHKKAARYGRDVRTATMVYIVTGRTDEEAQRTFEWLQDEVDTGAMSEFIGQLKGTSYESEFEIDQAEADPFGGMGREMYMRLALGIGAWHIVGSADTVAEKIRELHGVGIESILTCFFDPVGGLHEMEDHIMPALRQMGLRK
jgi:dimethylsulfone monooxygenase